MEIVYFKLDTGEVLAHARKNSIITVWYKNGGWEMSPSSAWILEKDKKLEEITENEALSLCDGNCPRPVLEKILGILE
ncbi:MAG: hypothetical protein IJ400_05540 [Clostridia bacterium]|nr:hypothetical protein [Clostridia bacterium]